MHLEALQRATPNSGTVCDTFWRHCIEERGPLDTPCWIWTRGKNTEGRGVLRVAGKLTYAYRHAFTLLHGKPPSELALHECDTPECVRHIFDGTQERNMQDCSARDRLHGPQLEIRSAHDIRIRHADGQSIKVLAVLYSVSVRTIMEVCKGNRYVTDVDQFTEDLHAAAYIDDF